MTLNNWLLIGYAISAILSLLVALREVAKELGYINVGCAIGIVIVSFFPMLNTVIALRELLRYVDALGIFEKVIWSKHE